MKLTQLDYENPWRPNYEIQAVSVWIIAAVLTFWVNFFTNLPSEPIYLAAFICLCMASLRFPSAFKLYQLQKHLKGRPLEYNTFEDLKKISNKNPDQTWLGKGFIWEQKHAQRIYEITKRSISHTISDQMSDLREKNGLGARWIHGVEPQEYDLFQHVSHSDGMVLITGTTGSGKTRTFDQLISQAVLRNEPVIIIDPKGDKELRDNARRACEKLGRGHQFAYFHPSFPEESVCIDPFANYNRITELASRIAALIVEESAFKEFAWLAANNINEALALCGINPTLITLKRFLQNGSDHIVWRAIESHFIKNVEETPSHSSGKKLVEKAYAEMPSKGDPNKLKANALCKLYKQFADKFATSELDGIISMYEHDATHFSKMVTNIMPILNMLTSGPLASLLSPKYSDITDTRLKINSKMAIERNMVLYIGLDSLSDARVGTAIGSIILADIVATAGERYNNNTAEKHVNIFIDEGAEVINVPTIQLLNKGRGAKMRLFVATQTISDFEARLGSEALAMQALGNMNNLISLRVIDSKTQEYISNNLYTTRINTVARAQGSSVSSDDPLMFSSSTGERLTDEEAQLFPPYLLGMLPNLEFIAKASGKIIKGRLPILQ